MHNPYLVLRVSQDAQKDEIKRAQMEAMKRKEFSLQEISIATKQLLDPPKRLAADFMFPSRLRVKRMLPIKSDFEFLPIDLSSLDPNKFDSLNLI